jgi:hypothetical protein
MVPNTDYKNQDLFPPGEDGFHVSPVRNNSTEFLLMVPYLFESRVYIQNYYGQYLQNYFSVDGSIATGSMSLDGQYIYLFRRVGSVENAPWFGVYTRDGALVDQRQLEERPVFWLNDNRIVYSWRRTFYFTYPASTVRDDSQFFTLPDANGDDTFDGVIGDKAISPDGTKIAFTIAEGYSTIYGVMDSRLYMMNMDGTDLHLVATTYNDEEPAISDVEWSPDGRWIFVKEDYREASGNIYDSYRFGHAYIIPADGGSDKVYYLSEYDAERSPEVRMFWRYALNPEPSGITTKGYMRKFSWIPDPS